MPQLRSPTEEKKKQKGEAVPRVEKSKVVSAYSEEGQTRINEAKAADKRMRILALVFMAVGLIAVVISVILSSVYHWF